MAITKFYGSQVGGTATTPQSYTTAPLSLLKADIASAFNFAAFLPFIVFPAKPLNSAELCELYPSAANLWSMFLHLVLMLMQIPFIMSLPFWLFFPMWWVVGGIALFWMVNQSICFLLNGKAMEFPSNPNFAKKNLEHAHEQWIFLNGVAVGYASSARYQNVANAHVRKSWLQSNVDRIALTFGRPVLGVHNKTYGTPCFTCPALTMRSNGILFDIIQCLIQRNFTYATQDVRDCYQIVKKTLYNPDLRKVVFILHSQGGIEGGMIIDWLLQEVPQDLLAKLEVYTFGCAANHFNNPHLHLLSQHAALTHPTRPATTKTTTSVHYHDPLPDVADHESVSHVGGNTDQESVSGKTIHYIEHYAHTSDFVSRWGVLHFTCNFSTSPLAPRYMGRVFERVGEGHQFNQHYLDNMFPLKPSAPSAESSVKGGIGQSGFEGVDEANCEFMDSIIELGHDGEAEEKKDEREGLEISYLGAHGEPKKVEEEVLVRDMSPILAERNVCGLESVVLNEKHGWGNNEKIGGNEKKMQFKVKDLSRLWMYVNGKSPKMDEVDVGIAWIATI